MNINNIISGLNWVASSSPSVPKVEGEKAKPVAAPTTGEALTVTESEKPLIPEFAATGEVSEDSLSRDDFLGDIFGTAYSYSAPPPPDFRGTTNFV